ncbi:hypothetical protein DM01DRAFT_1373948 [Hesseltinella vesiculosa]|uniref:Uncharacterized protein n=1 Tax=Hesseltinella vesiculosa TaxID=101127 RepID=A0A1X2GIA1_9FUNG|nr:hypothetical protein DM01DRAFT_1373948 [Hesseltinella vesiculosa]
MGKVWGSLLAYDGNDSGGNETWRNEDPAHGIQRSTHSNMGKNKQSQKSKHDKQQAEIEQYVHKAEHAHNGKERLQFERHANKVHEKVSGGHAMKFDSGGHPDTKSADAQKCPALHLGQSNSTDDD